MYLRVFHPEHRSLFFVGLVQPLGCVWPLADAHAKLAANFIVGNYDTPVDMKERIQKEVEQTQRQFIKSARHTIEVEFHKHLWALQSEMPANAPRGLPSTAEMAGGK